MDLSDGFSYQLLQVFVGELPLNLRSTFVSDHRVLAVLRPRSPTRLLLGDLVRQQPVTHHQVALGDVEAFLGHAGRDQEVEGSLAEVADGVLLLVLQGGSTQLRTT